MTVVEDAKKLVDDGGTNNVTTSQLRKFLSAVNSVSNKVQVWKGDELSAELINEIQYLRVKLAYQAGRYKYVRDFVIASNLDKKIKNITTKKNYIEFARYIEAIIAFHKFNKGEQA